MRLRLDDLGEGWFWEGTSIDVEVQGEVRKHSRQFYTVVFAEPVEARESGEHAGPGDTPVLCSGAWLSPRWVGHEIARDIDTAVLLWMGRDVGQAGKPPRDVEYSARVKCRQTD